jgi:hypothetical protein
MMTSSSKHQISLLMPTNQKWSDKARLIQHYFQRMHHVEIDIVEKLPAGNGILIALEKDLLISAAEQLQGHGSRSEALLLSNPELYREMDDKSQHSWRQLPGSMQFNEIPTLNMMSATDDEVLQFLDANMHVQHFMLKPADEAASVGQAVIPVENISEIMSYLGTSYIAQPFFTEHKILTIDFLAIDGEVTGHHCFYVDGPIENAHWKTGLYQQVLCNATPEITQEFERIQELAQQLSKKLHLNGIFEIEFLYDYKKAYFLELNLLPGLYGIDDDGLMPVLEQVVVPYLQHFQVDIQPQKDVLFDLKGQFYPPSAHSLEYYINMYGEAVDAEQMSLNSEDSTAALVGESRDASNYSSEESSLTPVFLLMPNDQKWSDKALLIQHYFLAVHDISIHIVEEPPE